VHYYTYIAYILRRITRYVNKTKINYILQGLSFCKLVLITLVKINGKLTIIYYQIPGYCLPARLQQPSGNQV